MTVTQTIASTSGEYHAVLQLSRSQLTLTVNDQLMLDTPMSAVSAGGVGIILPRGTLLSHVVITEQ